MCLSPVRIKNRTSYPVSYLSQAAFEVPCGKCAECRDTNRLEWEFRISKEIYTLYQTGGRCIFLTFTYNNDNLPYYEDKQAGFRFVCFNRDHVLQFLNVLKVNAYRRFGPSSYKYFFTSEYGKDTRRPHYHCLFFLSAGVDKKDFTELCRSLWQYGFMFPKYNGKTWVDNYNRPCDVEIRSLYGGACYVSKYVCKDLSYFSLPEVDYYISDKKHYDNIKPYLPKHWQSNKLGFSALDEFENKDFEKVLKEGIFNPLKGENVPLPRYVINKLLYKNVKTKDDYLRLSKDGKPLYDRELTDFGRSVLKKTFLDKLEKSCQKMSTFFQSLDFVPDDISCYLRDLHINIEDSKTFVSLAIYHNYYKYYGNLVIMSLFPLHMDIDKVLSDIDSWFGLYLSQKDTRFARRVCDDKLNEDFTDRKMLYPYDCLSNFYKDISIKRKEEKQKELQKKREMAEKARRDYKCKFDKKLC